MMNSHVEAIGTAARTLDAIPAALTGANGRITFKFAGARSGGVIRTPSSLLPSRWRSSSRIKFGLRVSCVSKAIPAIPAPKIAKSPSRVDSSNKRTVALYQSKRARALAITAAAADVGAGAGDDDLRSRSVRQL